MSQLAEFLASLGYVRVPVRRSVVGHFHTDGTLNGRPVEILVDTGAAITVVDISVVRAIGLRSEWLNREAGGAGGAIDQFRVEGAILQIGPFIPRLAGPAGLDFEHINAPLRANGSAEVEVILGADVLDAHAAVIDYAGASLFLMSRMSEPGKTHGLSAPSAGH